MPEDDRAMQPQRLHGCVDQLGLSPGRRVGAAHAGAVAMPRPVDGDDFSYLVMPIRLNA